MRVYFKVTVWESVEISDDNLSKEIIKAIEDGSIETADELCELYPDKSTYEGVEPETVAQMSLDQNDYAPTIEVYKDRNVVFDNGVKLRRL